MSFWVNVAKSFLRKRGYEIYTIEEHKKKDDLFHWRSAEANLLFYSSRKLAGILSPLLEDNDHMKQYPPKIREYIYSTLYSVIRGRLEYGSDLSSLIGYDRSEIEGFKELLSSSDDNQKSNVMNRVLIGEIDMLYELIVGQLKESPTIEKITLLRKQRLEFGRGFPPLSRINERPSLGEPRN
jgi:hypothetical protein